MSIDITSLLAPISASAPAGEEARSTDEYEQVSAEIDKMTNMSGSAIVDWSLVAQNGADILRTQSKDFMLAAWVSAAWTKLHGLDGLKAGLELHAGLVEQYWANAFPPLKRLRGRRNALAWWLERANSWLEENEPPPLAAATHAAMVDAAQRLDQALAELDPESPPLSGFLQQIKRLDVLAEAVASTAPSDTSGEDGQAASGTGTAPENGADTLSTGAPSAGAPLAGAAAAAAAAAAAEINAPTAAAPAAPAAPAAAAPVAPAPAPQAPARATATPAAPIAVSAPDFPSLQDTANLDEVIKALQPVTDYLGQISSALLEISPLQPLLIEINRFAARAPILSAPPATANVTALMPPPVAIADAFVTICGSGNAEGIIAFCESRIVAFPFWLDLDRQAARGYSMLGEPGAPMRQAIIKNLLSFVERLPGIETLCFSDGTPFASDDTRQWLEECRAQGNGAAAQDDFSIVQAQARAAANDGRHTDALQLYQSVIANTYCGRDQFRARIALTELLLATHGDIDPMPLAQPLIHDCTTLNLAHWEPALAAQAWQTVLKACRQALANPNINQDATLRQHYLQIRHEALQHLARVDFPSATRFSQ